MRVETMNPDMPVEVALQDEAIDLVVGEPGTGARAVTLAMPQAAMLLHALGLAIAQIEERRRRAAEERAHLAQVVADTEVRFR
jgi:LDH2 family malate/lactate/ureidoglycolate dehydrogenase